MTLKQILEQYTEIIDNFQERFFSSIVDKIEKNVLKSFTDFIDNFSSKDGFFNSRKSNERTFLSIDKALKKSWKESGIIDEVTELIREFDLAEKLSKEFYRRTLKAAEMKDLTELFKKLRPQKAQIIDRITKNIIDFDGVSTHVFADLRNEVYNAIIFNSSVSDLKDRLRDQILTKITDNKVTRSKLLRYTHQIANDSLLQYQRTIHQSTANEFDLGGFMFVQSLIKTSRQSCIYMVTGTGPVKDLAIRSGVYRTKDIPKIVQLLKGSNGWNPATTAENYLVMANGYNCRGTLIPIRLTDDDIENDELKSI
ncbi:MAG: hypothetical protein HKN48_00025 [Flavobacteriaceae bacterium]|nr:hypothetical protein [Flavobacteriaceae bacterium]